MDRWGRRGWTRTGRPVGSAADRGTQPRRPDVKPGPGRAAIPSTRPGDTRPLPGGQHRGARRDEEEDARARAQKSRTLQPLARPTLPLGA